MRRSKEGSGIAFGLPLNFEFVQILSVDFFFLPGQPKISQGWVGPGLPSFVKPYKI
jgi:hypothetical protein